MPIIFQEYTKYHKICGMCVFEIKCNVFFLSFNAIIAGILTDVCITYISPFVCSLYKTFFSVSINKLFF